ncbi:hypothetical protein MMC07_006070 [Pseudocyphellaria aurata]|nr:hypothetical protein [Pseudocyphellaria aurata]
MQQPGQPGQQAFARREGTPSPPKLFGFLLTKTRIPGIPESWERIQTKKLAVTQDELSDEINKEKKRGVSAMAMYEHQDMDGWKRSQVDLLIKDLTLGDPGYNYKLVLLKLREELSAKGHRSTVSMRVILRRQLATEKSPTRMQGLDSQTVAINQGPPGPTSIPMPTANRFPPLPPRPEVGSNSGNIYYYYNYGQPERSPTRPKPFSTVPFRRDPDFVDRNILSKLDEICSKPASRAALVGLGGVGKSHLAIEYSYRIRENFSQTWVFWVHASNAARFEEGYRTIADRIKLPGRDAQTADILRLVSNWLSDEANGRWIMILDNVDDSTVFSAPYRGGELSTFLPQTLNGSILVTSRSRDAALKLTGRNRDIIKVEPMNEDLALLLLEKKLPDGFDRNDAKEFLRALDYMPLAISQAAAYISQRAPRITVCKYLDIFRKSDTNQTNLLNTDTGDLRRDSSASNSIITTWQISFEHIRDRRPSAARLLSLMSFFDRQGIPESLLHRYDDEADDSDIDFDNISNMSFEDDLSILKSYSLVRVNLNGDQFELHRLVQFSTRKWLELNCELEKWTEKYIEIIWIAFPTVNYENWTTCQMLFPHAEAVLTYHSEKIKYLIYRSEVLDKAGQYAGTQGNYLRAEEMIQQALDGLEKALGKEHPDTLMSVNHLALLLGCQGKYEEAGAMSRRALPPPSPSQQPAPRDPQPLNLDQPRSFSNERPGMNIPRRPPNPGTGFNAHHDRHSHPLEMFTPMSGESSPSSDPLSPLFRPLVSTRPSHPVRPEEDRREQKQAHNVPLPRHPSTGNIFHRPEFDPGGRPDEQAKKSITKDDRPKADEQKSKGNQAKKEEKDHQPYFDQLEADFSDAVLSLSDDSGFSRTGTSRTGDTKVSDHRQDGAVRETLGMRVRDLIYRMSTMRRTHILADDRVKLLPDGRKRISWICGCGKPMYMDVKELRTGAANELQLALAQSSAKIKQAANNQRSESGNSYSPFEINLDPRFLWRILWRRSPPRKGNNPVDNTVIRTNSIGASIPINDREKRFLLLCINTGKYQTELDQIDISVIDDDQMLFQEIRQRYYSLRRCTRFSFFIPISVRPVRFELFPWIYRSRISILSPPSVPPANEVHQQRYHYRPCPYDVDPPLPDEFFLHAFFSPKAHISDFWLGRLPKKLGDILPHSSDERLSVGWGIHIVEGPNWLLLTCTFIFMLLVSGVAAVVWSVIREDVQGGLAIGAYLVTVQTAIMTAFFFWCQQK